jgi:predicted Zn-dependent peptidase
MSLKKIDERRFRTLCLWWRALGPAALLLLVTSAVGAFDLGEAEQFRLSNGLTLIVLEAPELPVVSVQALYRVGARNEDIGRTGLTHFLEHMAFRASENFPDTELVSSIYAVGGEWHGYTWLDQITFFETLPVEELDLALRIEADRMARLRIPAAEVEAERGAVLTEMHGYENDPAIVLNDAVLAVSFLQHPYRNNTIGWESDVEAITHDDLVEFYGRTFNPANAILAVVGRVSADAVLERVRELFGALPGGERTPPPPTVEPPQTGVRRIELGGASDRNLLQVAYRAPAVGDPDYPAFLLVQQVLAGGRGINFGQNEFGDAVAPGTRLAGIAADLRTWYPPQAAPYVFTIAGSVDPAASTAELEDRLQDVLDGLIAEPPTAAELATARRRLLDELVFDLETTEDAAHQLAYFAGLDALDVLFELPRQLAAVTPAEISRVAGRYLRPHQRTIGWSMAGPAPAPAPAPQEVSTPQAGEASVVGEPGAAPPALVAVTPPRLVLLGGGLPVIFQHFSLSSAAYLRILVPATQLEFAADVSVSSPIWRHTSVNFKFRPQAVGETLEQAREALLTAAPAVPFSAADIHDPAARLAFAFDEVLEVAPAPADPGATAVVLVGDLEFDDVLPMLETTFGDLAPDAIEPASPAPGPREVVIDLAVAKAQAQLGYVVAAPPQSDPDWFAWRMLLWVLSHGYEGRLGVEAISRRGLVYYIDAEYLDDGASGRVSLAIGVDPDKLGAMRVLLADELRRLGEAPPTEIELAEAKAALIGRRISAAQSNEEVSAELMKEWVGRGRLLSDDEFAAAVDAVSRQDLERVIPAFLAGTTIIVRGAE